YLHAESIDSIGFPVGRPPTSSLFPYTTLFRSAIVQFETEFMLPRLDDAPLRRTAEAQAEDLLQHVQRLAEQTANNDAPCSDEMLDRKSTRLNSSHVKISYAVFCLKKKILLQSR